MHEATPGSPGVAFRRFSDQDAAAEQCGACEALGVSRAGLAMQAILAHHVPFHGDTATMIEIAYIVRDSRGVERLRTADKKAADAYDLMLENAERLAQWLREGSVLPNLPDTELEELTLHLARHARDVGLILKGKPPESAADLPPESERGTVTPIKSVSGSAA
ncbi:YebG family protein [Thiohalocapsa marina]|uniref:YebG family protein n=1 Tax=Thiohalocapsa marina TaxID=424902 RepID=UPI0036DD0FAC